MYVRGLDEKVSEPLLWELFLQAGPVVNTHMPKDRVTGQHQGEYTAKSAVTYGGDRLLLEVPRGIKRFGVSKLKILFLEPFSVEVGIIISYPLCFRRQMSYKLVFKSLQLLTSSFPLPQAMALWNS